MTKTINGLTATTSAAAGDFLAIWRAANSDTRKITKANFMGGVLTGGGTLATGGFTGTLPATGTLSLLGTAQTYSALKTFSAGLSFGQDTLNYYDEGTWLPDLQFGGAKVGITYTEQTGQYVRFGKLVWVRCDIILSSKGSSTGVPTISNLPFGASGEQGPFEVRWINTATNYVAMYAFIATGVTSVQLRALTAAGTLAYGTTPANTDFTDTSGIEFNGVYLTS